MGALPQGTGAPWVDRGLVCVAAPAKVRMDGVAHIWRCSIGLAGTRGARILRMLWLGSKRLSYGGWGNGVGGVVARWRITRYACRV